MSTFRSPRPNVVESNDGVTVEVLGRTGIRYSEHDRSCFVDSEVLATSTPTIAVWPSGIRGWDVPHEHEPLSDGDRERVIANISAAFASQDWQLEIVRR